MPGVTPGVWLSAWNPAWSVFRYSSVRLCQSRAFGPRLINIMYFIASSFLGMVALKDERVDPKSTLGCAEAIASAFFNGGHLRD